MKKRVALVGVFISLGAIYYFASVFISPLFPISTVKVESDYVHLSEKRIINIVKPFLKSGFIGISTAELERVLKDETWVGDVSLFRKWPKTLVIKIKEKRAVAVNQDGMLLDEKGDLLTSRPENGHENLPLLSGPRGEEKQLLQDYKKISKMLGKIALTLKKLDYGPTGVTLVSSTGLVIMLNQHKLFSELKRFLQVYPVIARNREDKMVRVDLRYRHGIAVQWK